MSFVTVYACRLDVCQASITYTFTFAMASQHSIKQSTFKGKKQITIKQKVIVTKLFLLIPVVSIGLVVRFYT